jgi:putative transposase
MARKRPKHPPVHRTDLLPSNLTTGKKAKVLDLLAHYRAGAALLGREQWRLFQETGRFNKNHDVDKTTFAAAIGAANRVQMCRYQVVGQLQGWSATGPMNSATR